jgi:hypothetical protein
MQQNIENAEYVAGRDIHNSIFHRELSETEKQSLFYRATGISCTAKERAELENLISDYGFTAKEIMMTRQAKLLVFDEESGQLKLKYNPFTKYFMYALFTINSFLISWSGMEIMTAYKIHLFPDNLILLVSFAGYGVLIYLFGRYGIWPFKPIQRLKQALNDLYASKL